MGKLYEWLLKPRLEAAINKAGGRFPSRHDVKPHISLLVAVNYLDVKLSPGLDFWESIPRASGKAANIILMSTIISVLL